MAGAVARRVVLVRFVNSGVMAMSLDELPPIVRRLAQEHPEVWAAFNQLGEATAAAGPLDAKTQRLIKLALAIGGSLEGGAHAHVRQGVAEGITPDELRHVALLAVTTLGWPTAARAYTWIDDELTRGE
jgi:alkylhydroperoxidase/carboxymuconolactone decarboxylase family protein YurZ